MFTFILQTFVLCKAQVILLEIMHPDFLVFYADLVKKKVARCHAAPYGSCCSGINKGSSYPLRQQIFLSDIMAVANTCMNCSHTFQWLQTRSRTALRCNQQNILFFSVAEWPANCAKIIFSCNCYETFLVPMDQYRRGVSLGRVNWELTGSVVGCEFFIRRFQSGFFSCHQKEPHRPDMYTEQRHGIIQEQ